MLLEYRGEIAALSAAFIWAIASIIYAGVGRQLSPLALNFTKGVIAIAMILVTLVITDAPRPDVSSITIGLLVVSGIVGIGFGDTAFFTSINCLGARRALLMESLAPPLSAFLALVFLGEQLSIRDYLGIVLTISGVAWVVAERLPDAVRGEIRLGRGVGFGILAAFGQASGAVMSRAALAETSISPLWSTLIRIIAGTMILLIWVRGHREGMQALKPMRSPRLLTIVATTAFASTFLAIWLQQTALKYTETGIAQSLTATSPLFILPVALWLGEKISPRAFLGALVALCGVWLLFLT
ncbi:MAG TPA: DMT family transporter [Elainellaceae cyanobacterium]